MSDPINHPSHYKAGEYECQDVQDALAGTLWMGSPKVVRLGNALKYIWRCCSKGKFREDVLKACKELLTAIDEEWRLAIDQKDYEWRASIDKLEFEAFRRWRADRDAELQYEAKRYKDDMIKMLGKQNRK